MGTPFEGATTEIEASMNMGIWNWLGCQMETNDDKWLLFVHHKPMGTYEIDPAFTKTVVDGTLGQPVNSLCD